MKTNKSVRKRFKVTAKGKVKRRQAGMGHLLSGKTAKRKSKLRKATICSPADEKRMKELMGE